MHTRPAEDVPAASGGRVSHRRETKETLAALLRHVGELLRVGEVDRRGVGGSVRRLDVSKHAATGRRWPCVGRLGRRSVRQDGPSQHGAVFEQQLGRHEPAKHFVVPVAVGLSRAGVRRVVEHVSESERPLGQRVVAAAKVEEREMEVRRVGDACGGRSGQSGPEPPEPPLFFLETFFLPESFAQQPQQTAHKVREEHVCQHEKHPSRRTDPAPARAVDVADVDVLLPKRPGAHRRRHDEVRKLRRQCHGRPVCVHEAGPKDPLRQLAELPLRVRQHLLVLLVRPHNCRRRRKRKSADVPRLLAVHVCVVCVCVSSCVAFCSPGDLCAEKEDAQDAVVETGP